MSKLIFLTNTWFLADIGDSLTGVENEMSSNFQTWANIGIGILILIYGGASFLGVEIKGIAKKWIIGGFVGAILIVNFQFLKDLFWSAIGG